MKTLHLLPPLFTMFLVFIVFMFSSFLLDSESAIRPDKRIFCGVSDPPNLTLLGHDIEYLNKGKFLFQANCATCHAKDMKTDATGPALVGSLKRWNNDTLALYQYIDNAQDFITTNHTHRIHEVHLTFGKSAKPNNSHLDFDDIKAILAYIEANGKFR